MAIVINGSGTVTGLSVGGLPDGTVDNDTVASGLASSKLTGALPAISAASLTNVPLRPSASPLIINGAMNVAQRGTSFTHANSNTNNWTVDRLNINTGSIGEYTSTQETLTSGAAFEAGFKKAARIDCTTAVASPDAGDYFYAEYKVEAQDCSAFKKGTSAAETMTVAFWVKSNKTGTGQLNVRENDNDRMCSGTYTISSANTWEHKVINIAADTTGAFNNDNGIGYSFEFWLGSGSTYSSGTAPTAWEARAGGDRNASGTLNINDNTANDWAITGLQVEVGTYTLATLPPFQHRSYGEELALCQRYYHQIYPMNGGNFFTATGFNQNEAAGFNPFPVTMRTNPTVTIYGWGNSSGNVHRLGSGDISSIAIGVKDVNGITQVNRSGVFDSGAVYGFSYKADAEL
jgi:hypothetical protein